MARSDWAALLTEPAQEYLAYSELRRFGLEPYLPQLKKRHHTRAGAYVMRDYPLWPRYLLIPINSARNPSVRLARGICRHRYVLADADGRLWRAPGKVIDAIQQAERQGHFNEILHKGDPVKLSYGVLATIHSVLASDNVTNIAELLMPLFGGIRATVATSHIVHA